MIEKIMKEQTCSTKSSRLILIGYRCCGKTTIAPLIAQKLGFTFWDADRYLEQKWGRTIQDIFQNEGESQFRQWESEVIQELCQKQEIVLATGGGVIIREENRRFLKNAGFVVWLQAEAVTLWNRMQNDPQTMTQRPNLAQGGLAEIEQILTKRTLWYQETCHLAISAELDWPEILADRIVKAWSQYI